VPVRAGRTKQPRGIVPCIHIPELLAEDTAKEKSCIRARPGIPIEKGVELSHHLCRPNRLIGSNDSDGGLNGSCDQRSRDSLARHVCQHKPNSVISQILA
jgi:hypothetical protein